MPFPIGKARHRVTIQAVTTTGDGMGGQSESWASVATVWAWVKPLTGRENYQHGQVQSQVTHEVLIRYRSDVTVTNRLLYGSRTLQVTGVINTGELNEQLLLECVETDPLTDADTQWTYVSTGLWVGVHT